MNNVSSIVKYLDKLHSRGYQSTIFSDWIDLMLYSLLSDHSSEHPAEIEYMKIVKRYSDDKPKGERAIDYFASAFGELLKTMRECNEELLGIIYEDIASRWKAKGLGQFFTPTHVSKLIAEMVIKSNEYKSHIINDPTCGSGRMLVEANKINPSAVYIGQDIDPVCTKMTALNMCFFNMDGYAINGNTLTYEIRFAYKTTKTFIGGEIRELNEEECKQLQNLLSKQEDKPITLF